MSTVAPAGWVALTGDERARFLFDLSRHLETPLPGEALVFEQTLRCYPGHQLVRIQLGGREAYLLYAPGDPNPLDWTSTPIHDLNPRALRIQDADDAEAYLRFFAWAIAGDEGRFFITESVEDLPLREGAVLDPAAEARMRAQLGPLERLPAEPDDEAGHYRFKGAVLYGTALFESSFLVTSDGSVTMVDDVPIESDLPVEEDQLGSDRYFVLVKADGEGVLAAEFLVRLVRGEPVERLRVLEHVDARGYVFDEPIEVSRTTFNGDVRFEGARFNQPVRFERCTIRGRFDLREARIEASFIGRELSIGRDAMPSHDSGAAFRASAIRVAGTFDLRGLRLRGGLDLRNAHIDGDLRFGACDFEGWQATIWDADPDTLPDLLDLQGARIGGDLDFFTHSTSYALRTNPADRARDDEIPGFSVPVTVVRGSINAMRVEVRGLLWLNGLRVHGHVRFDVAVFEGGVYGDLTSVGSRLIVRGMLAMPSAHSRGTISLSGVYIGGDFQLFSAQVDGSLYMRTDQSPGGQRQHAVIRGGFIVSGIKAEDIELEGADVGEVWVITGDISRLRLLPGLEAVRPADDDEPRVRWKLRPCTIGALIIQTAQLRHALLLSGVHIVDRANRPTSGLAELNLVDCGGGIDFWTPRVFLQMSEPPGDDEWADGVRPDVYALHTMFPKGLDLRGVRAAAKLSLVNVRCSGPLRLNDCSIGQDLDLGSHGRDSGGPDARTTTECRGLELEGTVCEGDADFTGLRCLSSNGRPTHVLARRLRVAGKLVFSRPRDAEFGDFETMSDDPAQRLEAAVSGRLDLSVAEASHLVISGQSFQDEHPDLGVSFERGRFRRFQVVSPFPARHDPSDITVERWQIRDEHLLPFLRTSKPFRRSTYLGVERVLRNEGSDAMADEVYRAMRRRALRVRIDGTEPPESGHSARAASAAPPAPKPKFSRRLAFVIRREGSRILGKTIGWGTQNFKPLLAALLIFPVSWWVFSSPQNVVPSTSFLGVTPGLSETAHPPEHGVAWGLDDGAWMAARFQVPVIPILARERWEPSRDALQLRLPGADRVLILPWLSPEDYAYLVYLLHWVIWPLFLIGITAKVIRERP